MVNQMVTYPLTTETHPNQVNNLKFKFKTLMGKEFPLNDFFIYGLIEYFKLTDETASKEDELVVQAMQTLDFIDLTASS